MFESRSARVRKSIRVLLLFVLPSTMLVASAQVAAAQDSYEGCNTGVSSQSGSTASAVVLGDTVTISASGDCFLANSSITVTIESEPRVLGTFTADANGSLTATVRIPSDLPPGDHTIKLVGKNILGNAQVLSVPVRVVTSPQVGTAVGGGDGGILAFTGRDSGTLAGIAAAMMVIGAGLYVGARRRRDAEAPV